MTRASRPPEHYGQIVWEVLEVATGRVSGGRRDLGAGDVEVLVQPPPERPQLDLLRRGPRRVVGDVLGWALRGGRGSVRKRVRLGDGWWLVLPARLSPARGRRMILSTRRDGGRVSCWEWFEVDESGDVATAMEQSGSLALTWTEDADGIVELASTTVTSDVVLPVKPARGPIGRDPHWRLTIKAGSVVRWPSAADGIRLVPRLRPDPGAA